MSTGLTGYKSILSSRTVLVSLVGLIAAILSGLNIVQLDASNTVTTIEVLLGLVSGGAGAFRILATKLLTKKAAGEL